ncbi:COG1470 family protein [[Eubacterium] cellulosolvens]
MGYGQDPYYEPSRRDEGDKESSRRQIYALVGLFMVSVLVIGVVLAILSTGIGGETFFQRVTIFDHTPVTKGTIGEDIEITARVSGFPTNVTLSYQVIPNNASTTTFRTIKPVNKFMLLTTSGGDTYSYTISGTEILGDLSYFIIASDNVGNSDSTKTYSIQVDDFLVEGIPKEMKVYSNKEAKVTVTIQSINQFSKSVSLRVISEGLQTLPGGLVSQFNPASVTPQAGGLATSELTIRATSDRVVPGGIYHIWVEGYVGTQRGTLSRNSSVALLNVPDFRFTVSPSYQRVERVYLGTTTLEQITPFTITVDMDPNFDADFKFRVVGLPNLGVSHRWVLPEEIMNARPGVQEVELQVITTPSAELGFYTLTIYVTGGGREEFEQVNFDIITQSQLQ